jgi:GntR family transcriptional regulator/MocR family aminotransferase
LLLEIPLNYSEGVLYRQVAEHLEKMIATGSISSGERLPGTRELARMLRVSRGTVVAAYDILAERGFVVQTGRSGTYAADLPRRGLAPIQGEGDIFHFDVEQPTRDLLPLSELSDVLRDIPLPDLAEALEGAPVEGLSPLRRLLLRHAVLRGIPAHPDEVVVTAGGKDALSTALRSLRECGYARLWAEELSYGEIASIAGNEDVSLRTVPLLYEENLSCLERLTPSDVLYLVPSFQNPTGRTLSHQLRRAILSIRGRRGFLILEDDSYGELRYGEKSVPALKAMEEEGGVVYVGSFSQVLFPGMRLGYTLLPQPLQEAYLRTGGIRRGHVSSVVQLVVCRFLEGGRLADAVERARIILSGRMEALFRLLTRSFPESPVVKPEGGVYLWFPTGEAEGEFAAALAADRGVRVTPGSCFALREMKVRAVRFSLSAVPESSMEEAVARLERAWKGRIFNL